MAPLNSALESSPYVPCLFAFVCGKESCAGLPMHTAFAPCIGASVHEWGEEFTCRLQCLHGSCSLIFAHARCKGRHETPWWNSWRQTESLSAFRALTTGQAPRVHYTKHHTHTNAHPLPNCLFLTTSLATHA